MATLLDTLRDVGAGPYWTVSVIGVGIGGLAFLLGRLFVARPARRRESRPAGGGEVGPLLAPADRRAVARRAGNSVEVLLWDGGEAKPTRGLVQDRSQGGLRLSLDDALPEGAVLKVRPRLAPATTPWTNVIIRSCKPEPGGGWEARCQFEQSPPYYVLLLFG